MNTARTRKRRHCRSHPMPHSASGNAIGSSSDRLAERVTVARPNAALTGRSFLFLQSMPTRFFERLGSALAARGHAVFRVNFNGGDRAFWRIGNAIDFHGRAQEWPQFLDDLICHRAISDIILFGDCRPLHRAAIRLANERSLLVHVVEEGYMRPVGSPLRKTASTAIRHCPKTPIGIASEPAISRNGNGRSQRFERVSGGARSRMSFIILPRLPLSGVFRITAATGPIIC